RAGWRKPYPGRNKKAAVIGAGPAGLSAAYFLAREGFSVTVFDEHEDAGGVVTYNI
ncbi:MAG: FAD-dependent oxidoreductase, partial [Gammaproteobacteria bacterium]|nr:FAD-dependent oxidoreductase [Gammaproteobacteria bacterium]